MDAIPPEIWSEIFSCACTDDGSTGRALSTVSRAVHTISKASKYQSICVLGPNQLLKLFGLLSGLSPCARKVKYLFVAGLDECAEFEEAGHGAQTIRQFYLDTKMDAVGQALEQLLQLVSPNLVALQIHRTKVYRQSVLLEIEFPMLSELTLHGPFKSTIPRPPECLFPNLRSIHIYHFVHQPTRFLEQIVRAAPRITHLHVPQRSFSAYDIQVALGILQPIVSSSELSLPDTLQQLVIELEPVPSSLDSWASNIRGEQHRRKFRQISQKDARVKLTDRRDGCIPVVEARDQWLEEFRCPWWAT
ncbi:hypothetical protein B0H16DRAFT_1456325 [Mycena metata]|uniref:Uncharacterized protein n=1 Tax=Mycena metata TaxID=1033252 RepID=A0AAD7JEZ9_9AGAR|nr:hypothetical protein B0H16DRAFT_1456325 [Mycena metata]